MKDTYHQQALLSEFKFKDTKNVYGAACKISFLLNN